MLPGGILTGPVLPSARAELRAGSAKVNVNPQELPVIVNGSFTQRTADTVHKTIFARSLVLDDGDTAMAIVIVDSVMMPRDLLDRAKTSASRRTGIPVEHMLVAATHAHSVPSVAGALGSNVEKRYVPYLEDRIAESIARAAEDLVPAEVGSVTIPAPAYTAVRRWVFRPDRMQTNPFGRRSVRANMHPGRRSPDAIGPTGPEDSDLSVLSVRTKEGTPMAFLANFANHYFAGVPAVHPDYFGLFADRVERRIGQDNERHSPFVAMMSQGTSGDVWRRDYLKSDGQAPNKIEDYTDGLVGKALKAYRRVNHRSDVDLAIAESTLPLKYRVPDEKRLRWARTVTKKMGDRLPKNKKEVYAREAIKLHRMKQTELKLQAIRIGNTGITAIPNEVYALTGLKLKARSPLNPTINITLANGAEGYIPPPEQFPLGGYTTWPARTAGLERQAEPKVVREVLDLLESVSNRERKHPEPEEGPAATAILEDEPVAYWRLDEMSGRNAIDTTGAHDAVYEPVVLYYLKGPHGKRFNRNDSTNRCIHFVDGRLHARLPEVNTSYTVELWFWNGMVTGAREVTGWLFSRGNDQDFSGDCIGIGGTRGNQGNVIFTTGEKETPLGGDRQVKRWRWYHLALVRDGSRIKVYLNGRLEITGTAPITGASPARSFFVGGRTDGRAGFEGRIDEVAIFNRPLTARSIQTHYRKATGGQHFNPK